MEKFQNIKKEELGDLEVWSNRKGNKFSTKHKGMLLISVIRWSFSVGSDKEGETLGCICQAQDKYEPLM